jgi:hypothetical protein
MTRLASCAFALTLLWVAIAPARAADEKVDITGTWDVEVDIGGQTGMPEFTFKQEGEKLTGKYKGQFGMADVTGKVKGNEVEFSFELQADAKVTYTGTLEKDGTMKGKADYAGQASGTWKAKKKPAEKK